MGKRFHHDITNGQIPDDDTDVDIFMFLQRTRDHRPYEDDDEDDYYDDIDSGILKEEDFV